MRYYKIEITNSDGSAFITYTTLVNGQNDPGALNVVLDIPVAPFNIPAGFALCSIWGISLQQIAQANNLTNKKIAIFGGMSKGLPLANPAQQGLLVQGYIYQAYGNWIGTDMTLELVIAAGEGPNGMGSPAVPRNITLNWKKGRTLGSAVKDALGSAFSGFAVSDSTAANIVRNNDETSFHPTVGSLAQYVKQASKAINKDPNYQGIDIKISQKQFTLFDKSNTTAVRTISFNDLIGQPTWIQSPLIQFKCVMRADIAIGDDVKLPNTLTTQTQAAQNQLRQNSVFQGTFQIQQMRHLGNFRQRTAADWVTVFEAFPKTASTGAS